MNLTLPWQTFRLTVNPAILVIILLIVGLSIILPVAGKTIKNNPLTAHG